MTEDILALVPVYGLVVLAVGTFLSCLALPVPSSLLMLSAGGFAVSGDLVLWQAAAAALTGAILGDQLGYQIGRAGGRYAARASRSPRRAHLMEKARRQIIDNGGWAVFFSRWLVSPLGPYVNFAAGAAGLRWLRFTRASVAGEIVWVSVYVGLGALFADDIVALGQLLGDVTGLLAALAALAVLGLWLRAALRQRDKLRPGPIRQRARAAIAQVTNRRKE
ncbi:DedA [Roseibacterium elongatum DSM 19469]|uniref:DedA n=1 Tax=Roseicyclus elongatus DSM 19469 TaxID=1294273 RepID=W8SSX1_9RHOB|nr:DedA family protein [Roseibacterium elongatum]AHM05625.1 DedA [Roseibacterium elongatum DSM 19469]